MKKAHLARMTIDQLVDRFAEISVDQDDAIWTGKNATYNRLYDEVELINKELIERGPDAQLALLRLYGHPNIQTRLAAARSTLAVAPEKARQLLQWIAYSKLYPQAADAGMLLDSLNNGTVKPDQSAD